MEIHAGVVPDPAALRAGIRRWTAKQVAADVIVGGLMFLLAGSIRWPGAWLMLACAVASQAIQRLVVGRHHPGLLAERSAVGESADRIDVPLAMATAYAPMLGGVAAGLERRRGRTSAPGPRTGAALAVAGAGIGITLAAMDANPHFAPVLRIQADRGHTVAAAGPYRCVRHPGYAGAILYDLALPALLGSRTCRPFALAGIAAVLVRTAREDRYLAAHLPGYASYARRVRSRLLPGVW